MKFDNINKVPCIGEKVPVVIEDTEDARCLSDPLYAAIMGENFCTNAPVIDGLEVRDPNGVNIGSSGTANFNAYLKLKYTDGTIKAIKVTEDAAWSSAKSVILESKGNGEFKAGETDLDTQVKVTATYTPSIIINGETKKYTHQLSANSTVSIKQNCQGSAIDIVVVLDRSASMLKIDSAFSGNETRMSAAREACRQLIKNSKLWDSEDDKIVTSGGGSVNSTVGKEIDRMAFVSYAGDGGDGEPESRVTLVSDFVDTKTAALSLVDDPGFVVSKDCDGGTGPEGGGCWTSIGGGLEMAYDLLKGSNENFDIIQSEGARTTATNKAAHLENPTGVALSGNSAWPRKLIILLTDGYENVCAPDPISIAAEIRGDKMAGSGLKTLGHDAMIAVVGFMLDSTKSIKRCSGGSPSGATVTVENYLKLIANCYQNDTSSATSLTFFPTNHDALKGLFSGILQTICKDNTGGSTGNNRACFYIPTTGLGKGDTPQLRDQFGISTTLTNWNVCKNSVDLMGKDLFNTTHPNAGMYVSLIGNTGYSLLSEENQTQDGDQWELKSYYHDDYENKKCQVITAPIDHNFGGIETQTEFKFNAGEKYRLVLKVGGNKIKNRAAFTNQHGRNGAKLGSSIRVSIGGTQVGELENDVRATYPDADGIVDGGIINNIPILVTRRIEGVLYEFTQEIDPEKGIYDLVIPLPSKVTGEEGKIRIEQYPYSFQKVLKDPTFSGYEIPKTERERIFKDKGCVNIKGTSEDPLKISDFSGFIADEGIVVAGDRNEDSRYLTSGADEFLAPLPYGVVIAEVTLQKGTSSGDTWTTTETVFTDNFESEITPT